MAMGYGELFLHTEEGMTWGLHGLAGARTFPLIMVTLNIRAQDLGQVK